MAESFVLDDKMLKVLSNPIRRKILEFIAEGGATYTDLTETFELKSGPLYHHLRQMKQFVYQDEHKRYLLTEEGNKVIEILYGRDQHSYFSITETKKHKVFSIGKFSFTPFVGFFAKNPIHALIEFVILAGASVFIGFGNKILIVGNFVVNYDVPLWLAYISLVASWFFIAGFAEVLSRFVYKKKKNVLALLSTTNLIFIPSFLFILIVGIIGWISGLTIVIPSVVLLILHGFFQIWSFLILITSIGLLKELSIEKAALISMIVSYAQILVLIIILL
ncbi:MAG: winged helix-turn-helix transcriptional regulator [Candidatus Heimdallarchaeota archaeon]|nr:winged helix-turn-helix transcriptional regulator [Candidatus Heimdallarchaeota archaeon]MCK4954678.1 winged helix-turn-helix transcriptional regulator [Candidatus Heimdallarchaeota archaeon]